MYSFLSKLSFAIFSMFTWLICDHFHTFSLLALFTAVLGYHKQLSYTVLEIESGKGINTFKLHSHLSRCYEMHASEKRVKYTSSIYVNVLINQKKTSITTSPDDLDTELSWRLTHFIMGPLKMYLYDNYHYQLLRPTSSLHSHTV